MSLEVDAVYSAGMLKLAQKLPLHEGEKVKVTIHSSSGSAVDRLCGMLK